MILHIVTFHWKSGVTTDQVEALTAGLRSLPGAIPGLLSLVCGPDLKLRPTNPDYLMTATFHDIQGWRDYQAHELHKDVVATKVDPIIAHRQSMQIEING